MRVITVSSEQELHALVHELYSVPPRNAERISRQAVQALLEANPQLAGRTRVPAGTPLVVPDRPDLPFKAAEPAAGGAFQDLQSQVQEALSYARSVYEAAGNESVQEAKDSLAILRSREFRAVTSNVNVESLTALLRDRVKDAEAQAKLDLQGIDALNRALQEFTKAIAPSPNVTRS